MHDQDPLQHQHQLSSAQLIPGSHQKKTFFIWKSLIHAKSMASDHWGDLLKIKESVLFDIMLPVLLLVCWSALITVFFMVKGVNFLSGNIPNSTLLVTILGLVMGLLLVFRTNTSYDRFWEGRKTWGIVQTNIRNLNRLFWICVKPKNSEQERIKLCAMGLVEALPIAIKNYLRGNHTYLNSDGENLNVFLSHIPSLRSIDNGNRCLPLEITHHLQAFIDYCKRMDLIDAQVQAATTTIISILVDAITSFERIKFTPIPFAYSVHIKQTLALYLICLPFQLAPILYWATIPSTLVAAFTFLGIEAIGGQIENPFGEDPNDLPLNTYTKTCSEESKQIMGGTFNFDSTAWRVYSNSDLS